MTWTWDTQKTIFFSVNFAYVALFFLLFSGCAFNTCWVLCYCLKCHTFHYWNSELRTGQVKGGYIRQGADRHPSHPSPIAFMAHLGLSVHVPQYVSNCLGSICGPLFITHAGEFKRLPLRAQVIFWLARSFTLLMDLQWSVSWLLTVELPITSTCLWHYKD